MQVGPDSPATTESADIRREEVSDGVHQETAQYIGDAVAENIVRAFGRLDDATEELQAQTCDVCQRIGDPQAKTWFSTDEMTLALPVIRFASEEFGGPIPYPALKDALEGRNYDIQWVTKLVRDKVR